VAVSFHRGVLVQGVKSTLQSFMAPFMVGDTVAVFLKGNFTSNFSFGGAGDVLAFLIFALVLALERAVLSFQPE